MKKILILLLCLLLFFSFILWVHNTLEQDVTWILNKTAEITGSLSDPAQTMELFLQLKEHWNSQELFWGMLLPHDNLQDINKEIEKLGVALQNQNKEDTDSSAAAINKMVVYLLQRNTLRWDHIF